MQTWVCDIKSGTSYEIQVIATGKECQKHN